jgi:hypothetical protein
MRRAAIVIAAVLLALLVLSQLLLPGIAAREVEDRLTKGGGNAEANVDALPALRLLFGDGDRLAVEASDLDLGLVPPRNNLLDDLDGFDEVDVVLHNVSIPPFDVYRLSFKRNRGEKDYRLDTQAKVTGRDLAGFAGGEVAGPLGGLAGSIVAGAIPMTDAKIPIDVAADVESRGGRPHVARADGTVAGLPAGIFIEALAAAIAARIGG